MNDRQHAKPEFHPASYFMTYFPETKLNNNAGHICDPFQLSDTKQLQP